MYRIKTLNEISAIYKETLSAAEYTVGADVENPEAILVRSADMHKLELPESLVAVARAGAGVNNIPIEPLAQKGVVVFNTPGANANAVKELVIAGALLSARNLFPAAVYVRDLEGSDDEMTKAVEAGSKATICASTGNTAASAAAYSARLRKASRP